MRPLVALVMAVWATTAAADLYRWIDPDSGSIKYSSYPPPWYGDAEQERRAPRVEHIPSKADASARAPEVAGAKPPPAPAAGGGILATLEARRRSLMQMLTAIPAKDDFNRSGAGIRQQLEAYQAAAAELDRVDPSGAARRRAESQPLIERLIQGLRAQFGTSPPDGKPRER